MEETGLSKTGDWAELPQESSPEPQRGAGARIPFESRGGLIYLLLRLSVSMSTDLMLAVPYREP